MGLQLSRLVAPVVLAPIFGFAFPGQSVANARAPNVLYSFGSNSGGQLGVAIDSGTTNANPTPEPVSLPGTPGTIIQLAAGGGHSLVVTTTGRLFAFGDNSGGELGNTTPTARSTPIQSPAP